MLFIACCLSQAVIWRPAKSAIDFKSQTDKNVLMLERLKHSRPHPDLLAVGNFGCPSIESAQR
jgi:hypothetical protein